MSSPQAALNTRVRDGEPPRVASRSQRGPRCDRVDADVVCVGEGIAESVEFKSEGVNDTEDRLVKIFFSELSAQSGKSPL
jgi:hypothetical protein